MKTFNEKLTFDRARELLDYDPDSGILRWRVRTSNRVRPGDIAGCQGKSGKRFVILVRIDGTLYLASRVIWLLMTGVWPDTLIDHEDRDSLNNRWSNLRKATHSQNGANLLRINKYGKGISVEQHGKRLRYKAEITYQGHRYWLGWHPTIEQARAAYNAAASILFNEFARTEEQP